MGECCYSQMNVDLVFSRVVCLLCSLCFTLIVLLIVVLEVSYFMAGGQGRQLPYQHFCVASCIVYIVDQ